MSRDPAPLGFTPAANPNIPFYQPLSPTFVQDPRQLTFGTAPNRPLVQTVSPQARNSNIHISYNSPAHNQQAVRRAVSPNPQTKMNVLHRPEVYSGNYEQNRTQMVGSNLNTIKEERSQFSNSVRNSQKQPLRTTQGYHVSEEQKTNYEREKSVEKPDGCFGCCYSKK